ncbi:hypothetical protein AMYX_07990 [Anaeromyxobacter diazotrophicus]|uniref:Uncharacterized protein n=1 Tax=Anaeromyxobacter diazotrophicus TaxID=2590199 RepID=A0A7I9VIT6_9BACT|nr:hypothetical protein AMYX_07990 [Anaeromyxobacter diazotrophicus]
MTLLASLTRLLLGCMERMDREDHLEEQIAAIRKQLADYRAPPPRRAAASGGERCW